MRVAVLGAGVALACGDGQGLGGSTSSIPRSVASYDGATAVFTTVPLDTGLIMGWVPVGNMNPPGHTIPTDHQYIYLKTLLPGGGTTPLYAPGAITIVRVSRTQYNTGASDYAVTFAPCAEVLGTFGHVSALEPDLLAEIGAFDQECQTYSPTPTQTVTMCQSRPREIRRAAGVRIGASAGLDLSLFDNRLSPPRFANPSRWRTNSDGFDSFHVGAFSDYYAEPMRSWVRSKLGSFDGRTRRTAEPVGGTIDVDVAGTVQGAWLAPGAPTYPEIPHLTIAPDNVDPTRVAFSMGTARNGVPAQAYFALPLSGPVTLPRDITPTSGVVCWEFGYSASDARGLMLVQLTDATTLRFEPRGGGSRRCTDADAHTLTSASATFVR